MQHRFHATLSRPDVPAVWEVYGVVDGDGHLNIYISGDGTTIEEVETGQGDGLNGRQLALRFTTHGIEQRWAESENRREIGFVSGGSLP